MRCGVDNNGQGGLSRVHHRVGSGPDMDMDMDIDVPGEEREGEWPSHVSARAWHHLSSRSSSPTTTISFSTSSLHHHHHHHRPSHHRRHIHRQQHPSRTFVFQPVHRRPHIPLVVWPAPSFRPRPRPFSRLPDHPRWAAGAMLLLLLGTVHPHSPFLSSPPGFYLRLRDHHGLDGLSPQFTLSGYITAFAMGPIRDHLHCSLHH